MKRHTRSPLGVNCYHSHIKQNIREYLKRRHQEPDEMTDTSKSEGIDEGLYSRQLYVLGHAAMKKMAVSNVLISGMGGLGVEIAKNVILAGVKSVTIHDNKNAELADLSSQFYLQECDIGKNRAQACIAKLAELNSYVPVKAIVGDLTDEQLRSCQVVVLTDSTLDKQSELGNFCHEKGICFIVADTKGLFGQIFCDFGDNFVVSDVNGEEPVSNMIASITKDADGVVACVDETRHNYETGDYVTFTEIKGMTELNGSEPRRVNVLGPFTFSIGDTSNLSDYVSGGIATQVKMSKTMQFKSFENSLKEPEFVFTDFAKFDRPAQLHVAFQALHQFIKKYNRSPAPYSKKDGDLVLEIATSLKTEDVELNEEIIRLFAAGASGNVCPMQAVIGGITAQEVLKACSGKFGPINQWLYFDAVECLPVNPLNVLSNDLCMQVGDRYDGQVAVFGRDFQQKLADAKYFLVGAGAIGCELLKNWAMMGVGTSEQGKVIVTDMDTIEKSNLNRQFLFRSGDVSKAKSSSAAQAVLKMNPNLKIESHMNRVGKETETVYDDSFFENLTGVANALDNVEARRYVDTRCVFYKKSLLESGTLGTKGSIQVIIPDVTESYSASQDPPEKSVPVCTLKNFPNLIEHTLQWARDMFEGLFTQPVQTAAQYLNDPSFHECTMKLYGDQRFEAYSAVKKILVDERPQTFKDCVAWAKKLWHINYHNQIKQLLTTFPKDQITSTGTPFWSGPKRCPHSLEFDSSNSMHLDFIEAAAHLNAYMYGIPSESYDRKMIAEIADEMKIKQFHPKYGVKIAANDEEAKAMKNAAFSGDNDLAGLISSIPEPKSFTLNLRPIDFEKDDDTNHHIDFIVAASNLRAENYDIAPADRHKSKLIAGKIIPAIATTTAAVVGLVCLEMFKLIQGHTDAEKYKDGFINLALPFFGFSEPKPPVKKTYCDISFSEWDRIEINEDMTLRELLAFFEEKYKLNVSMLSFDVAVIYAFYLKPDKLKERLDMTLSDLAVTIGKEQIHPQTRSLVFTVCCDDEDGDDVDVPYIKYNLKR